MAVFKNCERGLTLVELVIGMAVMSLIMAAVFGVLSTSLRAHDHGIRDEYNFTQARGAMTVIVTELREATVTAPAPGATGVTQVSYIHFPSGENRTIAIGAGAEAGMLVIIRPNNVRQTMGGGAIQALSFGRDAAPTERRITVTVTASSPAAGAAAAVTLATAIWTGSI